MDERSAGNIIMLTSRSHVVHIADDMAIKSGGVPAVVRQLCTRFSALDQDVTVIHAQGDSSDLAGVASLRVCRPSTIGRAWNYSAEQRRVLAFEFELAAQRHGCVHIHGLWMAVPTLAVVIAKGKVPALFTAHGMLTPWLWSSQGAAVRAKKTIFWNLVAARALNSCALVHAITPLERDELRTLLPSSRIETIPNAIDVGPSLFQSSTRRRLILFIGRIEPKKGVDVLIKAFGAAKLGSDWRLDIVGPTCSHSYSRLLSGLVRDLNLESRVRFLGPQFGEEKTKLLSEAWVMVVPSHSEVVGLVNLEAAAAGLPTITTFQTGLWDWEQGGGTLVEPNVEQVAKALKMASLWSFQEQFERGLASFELVKRRYSWTAVLPLWRELYSELMNCRGAN